MNLRLLSLSLLSFSTAGIGALSAHALEYSNRIPRWQVRALEKDLARLDRMKFEKGDTPELRKLFGIADDRIAAALHAWLNERVKFMVSEDWEPALRMIDSKPARFSDPAMPDEQPYPRPPYASEEAAGNFMIFLENTGGDAYGSRKLEGEYGSYFLDSDHQIEIRSPRDGIVKMGPGLFYPALTINPGNPDSEANSIYRLATLFHEARHSDGHGASLSFSHAYCPIGHSLQGLPGCDLTRNGAYTIDGEMTRWMLSNCRNCTTQEKEILRVAVADDFSRVISSYKVPFTFKSENDLRSEVAECSAAPRTHFEAPSKDCVKKSAQLKRLRNGKIHLLTENGDESPERATPL